jgi:hypothetical protein
VPRAAPSLALALLALALAAPAAALEFGTLFHSPKERTDLDRLRRGDPPPAAGVARDIQPEVTGFVKRSDGRNTLWIDGRAIVTTSPRAAPLLDPREVRDGGTRFPESSVRSQGSAPSSQVK